MGESLQLFGPQPVVILAASINSTRSHDGRTPFDTLGVESTVPGKSAHDNVHNRATGHEGGAIGNQELAGHECRLRWRPRPSDLMHSG